MEKVLSNQGVLDMVADLIVQARSVGDGDTSIVVMPSKGFFSFLFLCNLLRG